MDRHVIYKTKGTCAAEISFDLIDGYIRNVKFVDGCAGGTKGIARMVEGMKAEEAMEITSGVPCHDGTSCPDQLARAIKQCIEEGL